VTARAPMTRLARVCRAPGIRTRTRRIYEAHSACGRWHYLWQEMPSTPWMVTFLPTKQVEWFASLPAARRWTASPEALVHLRLVAQLEIDRGGRRGEVRYPLNGFGRPYRFEVPEDPDECAARVAEARRRIEIIDSLEVPGAT
jgi:hypothetical protein